MWSIKGARPRAMSRYWMKAEKLAGSSLVFMYLRSECSCREVINAQKMCSYIVAPNDAHMQVAIAT